MRDPHFDLDAALVDATRTGRAAALEILAGITSAAQGQDLDTLMRMIGPTVAEMTRAQIADLTVQIAHKGATYAQAKQVIAAWGQSLDATVDEWMSGGASR